MQGADVTSVWREGIKKIMIALVPTTLKGNKWLFNFSTWTKREEIIKRWWIKQKEATRKGCSRRLWSRQRKYAACQKPSSFYLTGAAAVMHPCGPHFNNWTDIGAAPAGSPNHRRSFEQTAVTLQHQAWQRSAAKYRQRGRGEGKKRMHSKWWTWPGAT